jgi:hypothetical protein
MGYHHADGAPQFALDADAVRRDIGLSSIEESGQNLQQLLLVYRAAAKLEVYLHVLSNGSRAVQCADVFRRCVNYRQVLLHVLEVSQGLNASGGGAGSNCDQESGLATHSLDAFRVLRSGNRAFNQGKVIGAPYSGPGCLREIGDVDLPSYSQQFILAVQQG